LPLVSPAQIPVPGRRRAPVILLEVATLLSATGNAIAGIVLPWLVLERTGSAAATGIVGAASALPLLGSSLFSGTIVDVFGRRRSAVVADVLSALSVAAIPLVDAAMGLDVVSIAVLAAIGAVFDPPGMSGRESMLPSAAGEAGFRLDRVNGVHEAIWGAAFLVGPGLGGLLILWVGAAGALWATAIGFVASAAMTGLVRVPHADVTDGDRRLRALLRSTGEGLRFVWDDRLLRTLALFTMVLVGIYLPVEVIILPVHFEALGRPAAFGFVITAMGAGGVVGSLVYGAWGHRLPRRALFVGSLMATTFGLLLMSLLPPFPVLLVAGAMVGLAFGPVNPLANLAMQARTPERLRGRVVGILTSTQYTAGPLGFLLVGPLVGAFGVEEVFLAIGISIMVVASSAFVLPSLRELDDPALDAMAGHEGPEHPLEPPIHPAA
jgi:MFS family permease